MTSRDRNEYSYFNIKIENFDNSNLEGIPANFIQNLNQELLVTPSSYQVAVQRFNIPSRGIPISIWDDSAFEVQLVDKSDNTTYTSPLLFVPNHNPPQEEKFIWDYQEIVDILNTSLSGAHTLLLAANGGAPPNPPFAYLDNEQGRIRMYIPADYLPTLTGISVRFNNALYENIGSLKTVHIDSSWFQLNPQNYNNLNTVTLNTIPYILMDQKASTLETWNSIYNLILLSDNIPVNAEFISETNKTRRILTDFEPAPLINDNAPYQFYPQGPLRWYDLDSQYPLRTVDVKVAWEDKKGNIYPLLLLFNDVITIKLVFRRKYENDYDARQDSTKYGDSMSHPMAPVRLV